MALGEHGFVRYKKTLLAKLTEEIKENGQMPECTESLEKFWTFLVVDEDSPQYVKKTKEVRVPCVCGVRCVSCAVCACAMSSLGLV
jgi:hypothetical protein